MQKLRWFCKKYTSECKNYADFAKCTTQNAKCTLGMQKLQLKMQNVPRESISARLRANFMLKNIFQPFISTI
jgi:hypothetical protein